MDDRNSGAIDISSIDLIQRGQSTLKFERALGHSKQTLMRTNVKCVSCYTADEQTYEAKAAKKLSQLEF